MENKHLFNRSKILPPHKPLGQELPSLQFMWPLGAQPLNILDTSIQQKRQQSSSQDWSRPFAKSPFFSTRSAPTIQRRRNASQVDLSPLNSQLKREYSNIDISPQIPQSIDELEYPETANDNQASFDDSEVTVDAADLPEEIDVNQLPRLSEIDNPQQAIELSNSIPTPGISPQVQPDSISLSKTSGNSNIFPINADSSANHDTSTNLDVDEDLEPQDNPIDLSTDPTVSVDSPIDLNLKIDQNPSSSFSASPPIESYPDRSIQESTISTTPVPLISSSSAQSEVVTDGYKQIENSVVNDIPELLGVNVGLDSTSNEIHRQSEIQAPIDITNTLDISISSVAPTTVPSQLELIPVSSDSEAEFEPERIAEVQPSVVATPSRLEQGSVLNENTSGENNRPDLISSVDSDSSVINASPSSEASSNSIFQNTTSTDHQEPDVAISDPQNLTSLISTDMSAVIAASPIDYLKLSQTDRTILSSQADVVAPSNELIDPQGNDDDITTVAESSLASSIISPLLESDIETTVDDQPSLNLDLSSPVEPLQANDISNPSQTFSLTSNSEAEPSEVESPMGNPINSNTSSSILTGTDQGFDLNHATGLMNISPIDSNSSADLVVPDRDILRSDQLLSKPENIVQYNASNISVQQAPSAIDRSLIDVSSTESLNKYQSMDQPSSIQLSPESENINSPDQELYESNRIEIDSSFPDPPQSVMLSQIAPEDQGQNLDGLPSMIATQSSPLSIAKFSGELLEQVSESSGTSPSNTSIDINLSAINPGTNQSSVDLLDTTDLIEASESINAVPSQTQEGNIAELNHDATNRTETGSINDLLQRRIEPITESTPIESTLSDSINRFDNPAPPINLGPVSSEAGNYTKQSPEINQEISTSEKTIIGDDRQWDDVESPPSETDSIDSSDALSISTAMPRVLQRLSILDPQLTQPRSSSQAVNYIPRINPPLSTLLPAVSSTVQPRLSNDTKLTNMSSTSYSPVLQRFSTEESTTDRFDNRSDSPEMTSSWGNISDLLNSTNIDNTSTSFGVASSPGLPTMQAKSIEKPIPIFNEDRSFSAPTQTEQPFVDLRPYDSLPQPIDNTSAQVTDFISSNPTAYIAKLNSESQPVSNQDSIIKASDQTDSKTNTDAHPKDNKAGLEELAQITYRLIRQKIAIERERAGGYYSGRLPW
jgi:hypothetical protein